MGLKHGAGPQDEHMSPWDSEQDPSHGLHGDAPMDFSSSEQLVPGQATYPLYRYEQPILSIALMKFKNVIY